MNLFSLFGKAHNRNDEQYLTKISAAFDPMLAVVSPVIAERAATWNLENPVLSLTLGYIAGFLDSAYQLSQPKKYDEALIDKIFIDVVDRNLKSIPGAELFVRFSRLGLDNGGMVIGGMQDHPDFMQGRLIGGNDLVEFVNNRREGRPSVPLGLMKLLSGEAT